MTTRLGIIETPAGVRILRARAAPIVDRGQGVRSIPLVDASMGGGRLTTGHTIIPAGLAIPWHSHDADESIVVMAGRGWCDLEADEHALATFDATFIPAGVVHRIRCARDGDMRILWIYPAADVTRTLFHTGRAVGHLDEYSDPLDGPTDERPAHGSRRTSGGSVRGSRGG